MIDEADVVGKGANITISLLNTGHFQVKFYFSMPTIALARIRIMPPCTT